MNSVTIANQVRSLLATVNGLISTYTDKPLDLKSTMLASLMRSLTRCLKLCGEVQKLEEQELDDNDDDEQPRAGRPWNNEEDREDSKEMEVEPDPLSLILLEEVLESWQQLETIKEAIQKAIEASPGLAQAHMLDTLSSSIAHSIVFNQALESVREQRLRREEWVQHGGMTKEERELLEKFEAIEAGEREDLRAFFGSDHDGSEDHLFGTTPYKRY